MRQQRHALRHNSWELKVKVGDLQIRTSGDLTTVVWKDKWEVYLLPDVHSQLAEDNFSNEHGNALKLTTVEDSWPMAYVNKSERMAGSYSVSGSGLSNFSPIL
jgi:hypothetical protein